MGEDRNRQAIDMVVNMTRDVENYVAFHLDLKRIMLEIKALRALGADDTRGTARNGRGIALLGRAGTGKSLIIDECTREPEDAARSLVIKVPQNARASEIVLMMLEKLGDDCPRAGTIREREARCVELIHEAGIEIIFCDEIHHFLSRSSNADVNTRGGHWLKSFLDICALPTVIIGTPEAATLLEFHPELKRRFQTIRVYEPFHWDNERTRMQFLGFLHGIEKLLPLRCGGVLTDAGVAAEIHRQTHGAPGPVKTMILAAAKEAIWEGRPSLSADDVLQEAREMNVISAILGQEVTPPRRRRTA